VYLALLSYGFLFARREVPPRLFARPLLPRTLALLPTALFTARPARGLAPATFLVNAFSTALALAAIVPNVEPIDSATVVRKASSFDGLWLITQHSFTRIQKLRPKFSLALRVLDRPSPLNHSDQHNDDRQYQQNVNKSAECVRTYHPQEPQNHQDYRNRPKQIHFSLLSSAFFRPTRFP
jgi:hypothetical protein